MKKHNVYEIRGQNFVCILIDSDYACLAPITGHRRDTGYSIKLSKVEIREPREKMKAVGYIKDHNLYLHKQETAAYA